MCLGAFGKFCLCFTWLVRIVLRSLLIIANVLHGFEWVSFVCLGLLGAATSSLTSVFKVVIRMISVFACVCVCLWILRVVVRVLEDDWCVQCAFYRC